MVQDGIFSILNSDKVADLKSNHIYDDLLGYELILNRCDSEPIDALHLSLLRKSFLNGVAIILQLNGQVRIGHFRRCQPNQQFHLYGWRMIGHSPLLFSSVAIDKLDL